MYIKVRTMDGSQNSIFTVSKLTTVEAFRVMIEEKFDVSADRQRLFYRGKQMEDGYKIFDYNININDVIQMMVKPVLAELTNLAPVSTNKESPKIVNEAIVNKNVILSGKSKFYEVGNLVDAQSSDDGSWWEAKIMKITVNPDSEKKSREDDGLLYFVKYERYEDMDSEGLKLQHIRPRARTKIALKKVQNGAVVMLNYNFENPEVRGYWFDCKITRVINTRSKKTVIGTIITNKTEVEECHIFLIDEIFKIEKHALLTENIEKTEEAPDSRKTGPSCSTCKDNPNKKCNDCGCNECGGKEQPDQQLMCDECDQPFHIYCLDPPLEEIPDEEEWFCPLCKNDETEIVKAGEKLKVSKKKAALVSSKNNTKRDWGKGFACAGRASVCTIVPNDHFGPVPGVEVGSLWYYRLQVSEAGIHRPHVAGIHGRETVGAFSIVLAGGYEDDEDRGEEFTYTGSGGRDLSGNKRTAEQSCDQTLTRMNKALALNCNTPVNKDGAEAKNWKAGKPVRVVRSSKGKKHSKYAPDEGNRYDGIYKVVKYWQASGKSGHKVWRYLFRRDDSNPAPWTKEGKLRIEELGLAMQYPEGYLEAKEEKEKEKENIENSFVVDDDEEEESSGTKKKGRKRKSMAKENSESNSPKAKKCKTSAYTVPKEIGDNIENDSANQKVWKDCLDTSSKGKLAFIEAVKENFICVCCQLLVHNPVTTPCAHNVCSSCLASSFKAEVFSCPFCRGDLGKEYEKKVNANLKKILNSLFPGYEAGR